MTNFLVRTRYAIKTAYFFCVALINNRIAEFLDRRMETKSRRWTAQSVDGGLVPLGKINLSQATEKACKLGHVIWVDVEQAIIFYRGKA